MQRRVLQRVRRNCVGEKIKGERKVRWDNGMHFVYNMYDIMVKKESSVSMRIRSRHIKQSSIYIKNEIKLIFGLMMLPMNIEM